MNTAPIVRPMALALTIGFSACSAGANTAAFLPAQQGTMPQASRAARASFALAPHAAPKLLRIALTVQNVPATMRSMSVETAVGDYVDFTYFNTMTSKSPGCTTSNAVTTCKVMALAYAGFSTMTVGGYSLPAANGNVVFKAAFEADARQGVANEMTVPIALYVKDVRITGNPTGAVARGPEGDTHVWLTVQGNHNGTTVKQIVRVSTTNVVSYFTEPLEANTVNDYDQIAPGPNDSMWYVGSNGDVEGSVPGQYIGAMTTGGKFASYPTTTFGKNVCMNVPVSIATGPDGNAWFTEFTCNGYGPIAGAVAKISPAGTISNFGLPVDKNGTQEFTLTVYQHQIVGGKDGNVYAVATRCNLIADACAPGNTPTVIRATTSGGLAFIALAKLAGCGGEYELANGGDGNVWVAAACKPQGAPSYYSNTLARISKSGQVTYFYAGFGGENDLGEGPDGNLYMTDQGGVIRFVTQGPLLGTSVEYDHGNGGLSNGVGGAGPDGKLYVTWSSIDYSEGWLSRIDVP